MDIKKREEEFIKEVLIVIDDLKEKILVGQYIPKEASISSRSPDVVFVSGIKKLQRPINYTFTMDFDEVSNEKPKEDQK